MKTVLHKERDELLKTFDVLEMPVFLIDGSRKIVSCNESAAASFEYDRSEVVGRDLELFLSHLDDGELPVARSASCFRKSGVPFNSRIVILPYEDHQPGLKMVVVRDAPSHAVASELASGGSFPASPAKGTTAHIELINELGGIINSSLSIGTIFRMVVSELRKLIDYSRASLLLYDEKEDSLLIFALDTEMKTVMKKGVKAPIEGTSAGWVVKNNRPWISSDLNDTVFPLDRKL